MRVLILNQYALPAGEAGITRHGDIGAELVRRGHDVTVIASDFDYFTPAAHPARRQVRQRRATTASRFVWLRTGAYVGNDRRRVSSMVRYAMSATWAGIRERPAPDIIIGSSPQPLAPLAADGRGTFPSSSVDLRSARHLALGARGSEGDRAKRPNSSAPRTAGALPVCERASAVVSVPPRGSLRLEELGIDADQVHPHPEWSIDPPE